MLFFCKCFLRCALLLLMAGCQDEKNSVFQWDLYSQAPESSLDFQELVVFSDKVALMSQKRLIIRPYPGGMGAHGPDIYSAVANGRAQMGNGWPNWWSARNPAWAVLNSGPFDFMNLDASMLFFIGGPGTSLANELAIQDGVIWRPAWWPGMEFGLLSPEPIEGLEDLKGKKVRIGPGLPSEVLAEASGAFAVPLVPEEIRNALENGELDAVEWTTARGVRDLKLNEVSRYATVPAIWQPSALSDFLINKSAYDALPEDLQMILDTAMESYTLSTTFKSKLADLKAFEQLKSEQFIVNQWSDKDIIKWRQATEKVNAMYQARDEFTRDLLEQKQKFKQKYDRYYDVFSAYDKNAK